MKNPGCAGQDVGLYDIEDVLNPRLPCSTPSAYSQRANDMMRATDTASKLIELRQAKTISAIHNDSIGIGYVYAGFNNSGAYQNIKPLMIKVCHDSF